MFNILRIKNRPCNNFLNGGGNIGYTSSFMAGPKLQYFFSSMYHTNQPNNKNQNTGGYFVKNKEKTNNQENKITDNQENILENNSLENNSQDVLAMEQGIDSGFSYIDWITNNLANIDWGLIVTVSAILGVLYLASTAPGCSSTIGVNNSGNVKTEFIANNNTTKESLDLTKENLDLPNLVEKMKDFTPNSANPNLKVEIPKDNLGGILHHSNFNRGELDSHGTEASSFFPKTVSTVNSDTENYSDSFEENRRFFNFSSDDISSTDSIWEISRQVVVDVIHNVLYPPQE